MATARIEAWPGAPESRAYTADGRVNRPPGWVAPAPEHQERIARLIRERVAGHVAREAASKPPRPARTRRGR